MILFGQAFGFSPQLPERFDLSDAYLSEDLLYKARVAQIYNSSNMTREDIFGVEVYGNRRPLSQKQFDEMSNEVGLGVDISYREYVQQWLAEAVAPYYFRKVIDIATKNHQVDSRLITKITLLLIDKMRRTHSQGYQLDTIKLIREYIKTLLTISLKKEDFVNLIEGLGEDKALVFDFSSLYKVAVDENLSDENFYRKWLSFCESRIVSYIQYLKRINYVQEQLAFELQRDPFFLYSSYSGDQEYIYSLLTRSNGQSLRRLNYKLNMIKINFKPEQVKLINDIKQRYTSFKDIDELLSFLKRRRVTNRQMEVEKYSHSSSLSLSKIVENVDAPFWDPIRMMKGELIFVKGKYVGEYFIALGVKESGVFTYSIDSKEAISEIRKELQKRKKKVLYSRIVKRLSQKYPLLFDLFKCYGDQVLCYEANFQERVTNSLVQFSKQGLEREYLEEINSDLFEKSLY